MEIIKSKYTAEQLNELFNKMEENVKPRKFTGAYAIIQIIPYIIWGGLLIYGIIRMDSFYIGISIIPAIFGAVISFFKPSIMVEIIKFYAKKKIFLINQLFGTDFPIYAYIVRLGEKLSGRAKEAETMVLRRGESYVVLIKDEEGKEETYKIPFLLSVEDTSKLDFSQMDGDIDKLFAAYREGNLPGEDLMLSKLTSCIKRRKS